MGTGKFDQTWCRQLGLNQRHTDFLSAALLPLSYADIYWPLRLCSQYRTLRFVWIANVLVATERENREEDGLQENEANSEAYSTAEALSQAD